MRIRFENISLQACFTFDGERFVKIAEEGAESLKTGKLTYFVDSKICGISPNEKTFT